MFALVAFPDVLESACFGKPELTVVVVSQFCYYHENQSADFCIEEKEERKEWLRLYTFVYTPMSHTTIVVSGTMPPSIRGH
jgi:hypothetical protein